MAKVLTAAAVRTLRPTAQRREIRDGGCAGLYLVVQPSGHKAFAMRFRRPDGRTAKLVLGPVDLSAEGRHDPVVGQPLTLAAARRLAADVMRERARGRDVVADQKAAKQRARAERQERAAKLFGGAASDFVEGYAKRKTRGWRATARLLGIAPDGAAIKGGLAERWADRPVAEIDGHDIYTLMDEARQRGVPGLPTRRDGPSESRARHLLAALSKMFAWLHSHRRIEANPCAIVHRPDLPRPRDRVLTDAEVAKFWKAAEAEHVGRALKLLLLTGCRLNEVAGMRRSELTDDGATWTIPGSRTKNHRPHVVYLPPLARDLIASVPDLGTDLLFTTTGTTPVSGWSKLKRRLDAAMGDVPSWRLHDLRRTAATGMAELGVPPHIVEAALNHVSGARAGVAGTYNRAAYATEKKHALERWASHVHGIVEGRPARVIPIFGAGS